MIGVDTNVLIRLFVEDAIKSDAASAFVNAPDRESDPLLVTPIVIVEIEWVLRRVYDRSKSQILEALDQLCNRAFVVLDDRDAVEAAIEAWRNGRADLADCLIGALARERGARTTVTFDRVAAQTDAFTLLPA